MSHQWQIVAFSPEAGRDVCLYATHIEKLARQEWKASKEVGEPYSRMSDFRLQRREIGKWEDVSDAP